MTLDRSGDTVGSNPRQPGRSAKRWTAKVLVVANVTASSPELIAALATKARVQPGHGFMLVIPASPTGGRQAAEQQLADALERLRTAGLDVEGTVGSGDPIVAVSEAWDPRRYDEVIVSTLPTGVSKVASRRSARAYRASDRRGRDARRSRPAEALVPETTRPGTQEARRR